MGKKEEATAVAHCVVDKLTDLYYKQTSSTRNNNNNNSNDPPRNDCSILFGLAGGLQALWFLRRELRDDSLGSDLALATTYTILLDGIQQQQQQQECDGTSTSRSAMPLLWEWNLWPYLGAGTGAVGILYALLGHTEREWNDLEECCPARDLVRNSIDVLATNHVCQRSGNLNKDSSGFGSIHSEQGGNDATTTTTTTTIGWTHGAAGFSLLLLKAFDVYGDERYAYWAVDLCERVLWPSCRRWRCNNHSNHTATNVNVGLARGVSGIAYVFLALARFDVRQKRLWKNRARTVAAAAVAGVEASLSLSSSSSLAVHPNSLFDGMGGLASLLIDLERDANANANANANDNDIDNDIDDDVIYCYFPFFESCQANSHQRKFEYKTRMEDHVRLFPFHEQEQHQEGHDRSATTSMSAASLSTTIRARTRTGTTSEEKIVVATTSNSCKEKKNKVPTSSSPTTETNTSTSATRKRSSSTGTSATTAPTSSVATNPSNNDNSNDNSNIRNNDNNDRSLLTPSSTNDRNVRQTVLDISHLTDAFSISEEVDGKPAAATAPAPAPAPVPSPRSNPTVNTTSSESESPREHGSRMRSYTRRRRRRRTSTRSSSSSSTPEQQHEGVCSSARARREPTRVAAFLADRPTESWKAKRRGAANRCRCGFPTKKKGEPTTTTTTTNNNDTSTHCDRDHRCSDDDDEFGFEALMTGSVARKQCAEKSWIQHFGTKEQQLQYSKMKSFSPSGRNKSFRSVFGGFSSL